MDYNKFLNRKEHVVLAYLGGPYACGKDRRLRVAEPRPPSGFHRFEVSGRNAHALEAVDSPDLSGLPKVRGHHVAGWVVDKSLERLMLLPTEELPPFALVRARRWYSGDLLFESQDFDSEIEETARVRLERLEPLAELKGVPSSLRIAYGIAATLAVARRERFDLSPREAAASAVRVADEGEAAAQAVLADIRRRRETEAERIATRVALQQRAQRGATLENAAERAEASLDAADARMLSSRRLDGGNLEVTWEFMGERFISVVDALSLHVYDSGVCLAGADELVTLESLPSVIREAIVDGLLVITRR